MVPDGNCLPVNEFKSECAAEMRQIITVSFFPYFAANGTDAISGVKHRLCAVSGTDAPCQSTCHVAMPNRAISKRLGSLVYTPSTFPEIKGPAEDARHSPGVVRLEDLDLGGDWHHCWPVHTL